MITYIDVRRAIVNKLNLTTVKTYSKDVTEGFIRPSFFVQLDNVNRSGDNTQVHKSMTVQIYFFPTDQYEYAIEVLNMQETLENLFDLKLPILNRLINVNDFNSGITDGILNVSFDIEFEDGREIIEAETMNELTYKKE